MKLFFLGLTLLTIQTAVTTTIAGDVNRDLAARRHVSPSANGELAGPDGKPVFLISTSVKWPCLQAFYKNRAEFQGTYPRAFDWLYGRQTSVTMLQRCGFNALNFIGTEIAYRSLAPDYAGFGAKDAWDDFAAFIKKYHWEKLTDLKERKAYEEYMSLIHSASGIPVYMDFHAGYISRLTRNRKLTGNLINADTCFTNPDQHSAFAVRYALGNHKARELILKMYRYQTEATLAAGIRPFAYKLFNEPDYHNTSSQNRALFKKTLQGRYKTIAALNRTWGTDFSSFDALMKDKSAVTKIEYKKFLEQQVVLLAEELREMIRSLDPGAPVMLQVHNEAYRKNWNNFELYSLNRHMDIVSKGTGNYTFSPAEQVDDSIPFKNTTNPGHGLREYFGGACFYRALADRKPLVTTEAYFAGCGERYQQFKQVFWHEMIYGSSLVNMWEWIGYWKPKQKHNRLSYGLHNQNVVSPDSWKALEETRNEIKTVGDFFLYRRNRPQAEAACLFSYPTLRLNPNLTDGYTQGIAALTMRHIPVDAILEEQLPTGRQNRYKVIIATGVKNIYPESNALLRRFVENGGTLIVGDSLMKYDEYDRPLAQPLIDLQTVAGSDRKQRIPGIDVDVIESTHFADVSSAWNIVWTLQRNPMVVRRKLGAGTILAMAGTWSDNGFAEVIAGYLREKGAVPIARLRKIDSDDLPGNIGAHRADHDGMTAWYFVNYNDEAKLIRISAREFHHAVVVNHFDKEEYPVADDTVTLLLPPLYHRVIISGPRDKIESRFGHFALITPDVLKKRLDTQLSERSQAVSYVRNSVPLDLSGFANYGFDNQQGWAVGSAWSDSQGKDLKQVPFHGSIFNNTKFDIIRFDFNHNKTCIALKSKNFNAAPDRVDEIPLNGQFRALAFLHAVTHAHPGETVMKYKFNYANGFSVEVPISVNREIGNWIVRDNSPEMKNHCVWQNYGKGFFFYEWNNPRPSETLKSLSILSQNGESVPIVLAISTLPTIFGKNYRNCVPLGKVMKSSCRKSGNGWHQDGTLHKNAEPVCLTTINGNPLPIPAERLKNAVLRFQVKFGKDRWGKQMPVHGYLWPYVSGTHMGETFKTLPRQSSLTSDRLNVAFKKFRPSEWNEVEIPLSPLLKSSNSSGRSTDLAHIDTIAFQSNSSYLIFRDFRIEF